MSTDTPPKDKITDECSFQIGPYDEFEHSRQTTMYGNSQTNGCSSRRNKKATGLYKDEASERVINRTDSIDFEKLNWIERRKALNERGSRSSSLRPRNRPKNDAPQKSYSDLSAFDDATTNVEIYRRYGIDCESQKSLRSGNVITIQIQQWKQYGYILKQWVRRTCQQTRVTFSYPPLPPQHLMVGTPSIFCYFFFVLFSNIFHFFSSRKILFKKARNILFYALSTLGMCIILIVIVCTHGFLSDVSKLCTPPEGYSNRFSSNSSKRPLVEYYVHGRGNGHISRSIPIIRNLNAAGIDVRMFIGRTSMWKEIQGKDSHRSNLLYNAAKFKLTSDANEARTVAKLIFFNKEKEALLKNGSTIQNIEKLEAAFDALPWENEYALQYGYISDREMPNLNNGEKKIEDESLGTTTAISVSSLLPKLSFLSTISHSMERLSGDCEVSMQKSHYPDLVVSDGDLPGMLRARLGRIPCVSISHGTTFNIAEPGWKDNDRNWKAAWWYQIYVNRGTGWYSDWYIGTNFIPLEVNWKNGVIAKPPFRKEVQDMAKIRSLRQKRYEEMDHVENHDAKERNKLVLCYFRDKNGVHVVDKLLELGFDVVVFNSAGEEQVLDIGKQYKIQPRSEGVEISWSIFDSKHHLDGFWSHPFENNETKAILSENESGNQQRNDAEYEMLLNLFDSTSSNPRSIEIYDKKLFVPFLSIVDGIVGSGGSQLISESIYGRIPMLALHRDDDSEQMLNVEMLRRQRDEDIQKLKSKHLEDEYVHRMKRNIIVPEVFGTSIENFLSTFLKGASNSNSIRKFRKDPSIAKKELQGFVDAVQRSGISRSYYNDVYPFLNNPNDEERAKTMKAQNHDPVFPNMWFDGMPDAADVITEIVYELI